MSLDLDALFGRMLAAQQSEQQGARGRLDLDALFGLRAEDPVTALRVPRQKPLYTIDLATGIGMFALAFQLEGFRIGELCELDQDKLGVARFNVTRAIAEFREHLPGRWIPESPGEVRIARGGGCDARRWRPHLPKGGIDLLVGGPPCQPYSRLGAGTGAADPRDLFQVVPDICARARPTVVVMENVEGTARHRGYFLRWWRRMAEAGYEGTTYLLLAADYGSAQQRPRAFFVAWRRGFPGAGALRSPPFPTNRRPLVLISGRHVRAAERRRLLDLRARGLDPRPPWISASERVTGGCCYGLWSCNWLNNVHNHCWSCFKGDHFLETEAARDFAYPSGPSVDYWRAGGTFYVRTRWARPSEMVRTLRYLPDAVWLDPEKRAHKERQLRNMREAWERLGEALRGRGKSEGSGVVSWWELGARGARLESPPSGATRVLAASVPRRELGGLLGARYPVSLAGTHLQLLALPRGTVARRRVQFRLRPETLRRHKILDRARRMPPEWTSYLAPTLLAGFFRSMVGAIYATTEAGEDGIESLRSVTIQEFKALMDLPTWFVEGVSEGGEGPWFLALGNGVPLNLGRAVARHVWRAFGRRPLPEPQRVGLWPVRGYPDRHYPWCDLGVLSEWRPEGVFEVGAQNTYGFEVK